MKRKKSNKKIDRRTIGKTIIGLVVCMMLFTASMTAIAVNPNKKIGMDKDTGMPIVLNQPLSKPGVSDQSSRGVFLDEDFSGAFPPSGWTEVGDNWDQSSSDAAGGEPPEAWYYGYCYESGDESWAYLQSLPVDTTSASSLKLEFKTFIFNIWMGDFDCKVFTRASFSDSWKEVTPWDNPIYTMFGPETCIVDISHDIGGETQVRFEYSFGSYELEFEWYVDDVKIYEFDNDVGVASINYPTSETYAGNCTVNATIENFGSLDQIDVPVSCSIYGGLFHEEYFEADDGGYTAGGTPLWEWGTPTSGPYPEHDGAHSGSYCWGTDLDGYYVEDADATLDSVPITLPVDSEIELSFWHWYDIQSPNDGGNVKISTDDGSTWNILGSYQDPYPVEAAVDWNPAIPGEPCFSGRDQQYWEQVTFDLSSYAGELFRLRWHFGSDWYSYDHGWFIDDVKIYKTPTLIYSSETTVNVSSYTTEYVEFTPPWDAVPGLELYRIEVTTNLSGDEYPNNDQQNMTVMAGYGNDTGVISINSPTDIQYLGDRIVSATVRNFGLLDQQDIPISCRIYNETDDLVYTADTITSIQALETKLVEFTPAWHADTPGTFRINVTTTLPGDEYPENDAYETFVLIQSQVDVGVAAINYPSSEIYTGSCIVNATVRNFGFDSQLVPVNCSIHEGFIYDEEDFEADDGGYTAGGTPLWEWGTPTSGPGAAQSGSNCWGTNLAGDYVDDADATLDSTPVMLPVDSEIELSFWHWYDTESYYDGGNVKISTDGGSTWNILGSYLDPYPEDAAAPGNSGIPGEPCFSGCDQQYWEQVTFDLSSYAGEEVILRWHFGSDDSISDYPGWYIDDVVIVTPLTTLLYFSEEIVYVPTYSTEYVEFTPSWEASTGNYIIIVTTELVGDENPWNDQQSITVTVGPPPSIVSARSCRYHGVDEYKLEMANDDVEPRMGGVQKMEFTMDRSVSNVEVEVSCEVDTGFTATSTVTVSPDGLNVTVEFAPPLPDQDRCTITLSTPSGDMDSFQVRTLVGDVNQDGSVSSADCSSVKQRLEESVTTSNCQYDVNTDGSISSADISSIKQRLENMCPSAP